MQSKRTHRCRAASLIIAAAGAVSLSAAARADTITVSPGGSIQAAIAAALPGDEVVVLAGTYNETLNLLGKAITLRSQSGPASTILSGANLNESIIRCISGESASTVIDGFTLTLGYAPVGGAMRNAASSPTVRNCIFSLNTAPAGGAIANLAAHPRISACAFNANRAEDGGGIYAEGSTAQVTACTFTGNGAITDTGRGAGMSIHGGAVAVEDCTFTGNKHVGGGGAACTDSASTFTGCRFESNASEANPGGGIWCIGGAPSIAACVFTDNNNTFNTGGSVMLTSTAATVHGCEFLDNRGNDSGNGGLGISGGAPVIARSTFIGNTGSAAALDVLAGAPTIVNCLFAQNDGFEGGAAQIWSDARLVNCTFAGNTAGKSGGAILVVGAAPQLIGCTLVGNSAFIGGAISTADAAPILAGCIVWNNHSAGGGHVIAPLFGPPAAITFSCVQGGWPGAGNIDADPLLFPIPGVSSSGEYAGAGAYRLLPGSPCIDAATNVVFPPDAADLDADGDTAERTPLDTRNLPRFVDDPATPNPGEVTPPTADMGAAEHQAAAEPCATDWNRDGLTNSSDISAYLTAWLANLQPGRFGSDTNADGTINSSDISAFLARWMMEVGGC